MSFKSKSIGIIAGTALALSIASGAMADAGVNVTLNDNTGGGCSATLAGDLDLGDWFWDGNSYERQGSAPASLQANVQQTKSLAAMTCYVAVYDRSPLASTSEPSVTIPMVFYVGNSGSYTTGVYTETGTNGNNVNVVVALSDLDNKPVGEYAGSVYVTASTSSF